MASGKLKRGFSRSHPLARGAGAVANLVSIRLLRSLGTATAIDYITHFGFQRNALPDNLTLALGTTAGDPAADRIGRCRVRQWRLSRAAVFH